MIPRMISAGTTRLVDDKRELNEVFSVRQSVFIDEQGCSPEEEWDGFDETALHVIHRMGGRTVGCGRLVMDKGKAKLERIAVLLPYRTRGIGKAITEFMITESRERGAVKVYAHAQVAALGFYEYFGFEPRGEPFFEAGIEHVMVVLK